MKENFVIREERHPVGQTVSTVFEGLGAILFCIWVFGGLFMMVTDSWSYMGSGIVTLALGWSFEFTMIGFIVGRCSLGSYVGKFDVADICVKLEAREAFLLKPLIKFEVKGREYTVNYIKNDFISKSWKDCWYVNVPLEGNHKLELIAGSILVEEVIIRLDDVIIVEDGQVNVDRIEQIMSGSVSPTYPAPRAIDTGVMPAFQTKSSYGSEEKTVAPRTKRYAIVGETGKFANHQFNITDMLVLGRDAAECTVAFLADTAGVSRVHCKLVVEADDLCVYDLGSTYGTVVNNNKTISANQMMKVNHGDTITIGNSQTFVVREM